MRSIQSFMVFIIILSHTTEARVLQAQNEASAALLKWKASLDSQSQSALISMDDGNHLCRSWIGINCNNRPLSEWVVTNISLPSLSLKGSLDYLNFSSFRNLEVLDLSNNSLFGFIPSNLVIVSQLRTLDLGYNNFSGVIPTEIGMLPLLEILYLQKYRLTGHIPNSVVNLTNLIHLYLFDNVLTGPIPQDIGMLSAKLEALDFGINNLTGEIPSSLGNLTHMYSLYLDDNHLSGMIPLELVGLTDLEILYLSSNNFSGSFPKNVNLTKIVIFVVDDNKLFGPLPRVGKLVSVFTASNNLFSGGIPQEIGNSSSLVLLEISSNQLSGSIPDTIPNLSSLQYLKLDDNILHGTLPGVLPINIIAYSVNNNNIAGELPFGICGSMFLEVLHLSNNNIDGVLPDCFRSSNLTSLNLNGNRLQGLVPKSLMNCKLLEVLDLGNNMITDTFPYWLDALPHLQVLVLNSNKLHGTIESSSNKLLFPKLQILDLSHNFLTGRLPSKYFENFKAMMDIVEGEQVPTYIGVKNVGGNYKDSVVLVVKGLGLKFERIFSVLTTIDLSHNKFEGEIPSNIKMLNSLRYLNLSHNHLTGRMPAMLDNLTNLESLDLSSNQVQGKIPIELTRLTFLVVFNVSHNQLSGTIPQGQQFNTFGNDSYQGNPGLCGFPLPYKCGDNEEPSQFRQEEEEEETSGFFDGFTWESVVLGYGCGLVLGVGLGCLMFSTRKPIWVMKIVSTQKRRKRPEIFQFSLRRN